MGPPAGREGPSARAGGPSSGSSERRRLTGSPAPSMGCTGSSTGRPEGRAVGKVARPSRPSGARRPADRLARNAPAARPVGRTGRGRTRRRLLGFGLLAALPTAAAGVADWSDTTGASSASARSTPRSSAPRSSPTAAPSSRAVETPPPERGSHSPAQRCSPSAGRSAATSPTPSAWASTRRRSAADRLSPTSARRRRGGGGAGAAARQSRCGGRCRRAAGTMRRF